MNASVAGIVIHRGQVLIARRLPGGAMGDRWEFPGGKVEAGESDEQALIREYREEFNVEVRVGALLAEARFEHHGTSRSLHAYQLFLNNTVFLLAEHSEWRWAYLDELSTLPFADSDLLLVDQLKRGLPALGDSLDA